MSSSYPLSLPLKVMINKEKTKVLFAEANTEFTNVLLSFLALPLGKADDLFGSLGTLRASLRLMDKSYFSVRGAKELLLNPRTSFRAECCKLAVDITDSPPNQLYVCSDKECPEIGYENASLYSDIATCDCGKSLDRPKGVRGCRAQDGASFVTNPSSFIVTDELRVVPVLSGLFETLAILGITDTQGAELKSVTFDVSEIRKLFAVCLTSATPLTDMVIKKIGVPKSFPAKPELGISLHHIPKEKAHSGEMVLKVSMQKSTNKFLYAEATNEFVELLFSFLTIPVAGIEFLSGGNTGFIGIDSLYRSLSNDIDDEYFTTPETRTRLINPKLPYLHFSRNYFLPLSKEYSPSLYYQTDWDDPVIKNTSFHEKDYGSWFYHPFEPEELFISVKKHTKCIVTDDLTVNPSLSTSILILNNLGIPPSDVKETELRIGLEEALRILKGFSYIKNAFDRRPLRTHARANTLSFFLFVMA